MLITVVEPSFEILTNLTAESTKFLELAGRVCYKSEDRITEESADRFVRMLRDSRHESVLEHISASVRIIGSRSMSHQLVRHRLASYSQESQRFCNYGQKGFQVVCPKVLGLEAGEYYFNRLVSMRTFYKDKECLCKHTIPLNQAKIWLDGRASDYMEYLYYLGGGFSPEDARECLPNATKTEIVMSCNLRQWRHIFEERALNKHAQSQIRGIMSGILNKFAQALPAVFEDQLTRLLGA